MGIFFWQQTSFVLQAVLWMYYVNFPLLFHPVDVLRKFGFNGPVGVVVDEQCAAFVEQSLGADYEIFRQYARQQSEVADILGWVADHPDMTDVEICAGWNAKEDGEFPGIIPGYCARMAKLRALRVAMAVRRGQCVDPPDEVVQSVGTFEGWERLKKRRRS